MLWGGNVPRGDCILWSGAMQWSQNIRSRVPYPQKQDVFWQNGGWHLERRKKRYGQSLFLGTMCPGLSFKNASNGKWDGKFVLVNVVQNGTPSIWGEFENSHLFAL